MASTRPKFLIGILLVIVLTVLAAGYYWYQNRDLDASPVASNSLQVVLDQFAAPGRETADPASCIDCHREITEAWMTSHHAVANAAIQRGDLDRLRDPAGAVLEDRNIDWSRRGSTAQIEEGSIPPHPLVGTIGITPLIQYLYLKEDGRIQAHDVAWDVHEKEWFSMFEREDAGEEPRRPGEWGHWTGQGMNWDANCAYCHMTEYSKNYVPEENRYDRTWSHMAITCVQCHPGMDTHMAQIRNGNNDYVETLSPRQIMETCATCHARRGELTPEPFTPGDSFEDHYMLTLADVAGIYHPDGQVIGENYVYGSLMMSKMGHAGVTCMDCHDPHTNGLILPWENNALCMRCHGSGLDNAPKIEPLAHSHHPAGSTGNQCVECHMPVTYFMARDGRRDHSFSHPDPHLSIEMNIPNACTNCHTTQSDEWARRYTDEWYGEDMNADRRSKAHLMQDLFNATNGATARLQAAIRSEENRFWKSTFVAMLGYTAPSVETLELLREASRHDDPMVRAAAVRTAGLENFTEPHRAELLNDPSRLVRINASLTSPQLPVASETNETELRKYMESNADTPAGSLRLATYWQSRGDTAKARQFARQAVTFDRANADVWRLAAIELHGVGASSEAMEYFGRALQIQPNDVQALFNRGLLHYELGNPNRAIEDLDRAVSINPDMESAWYNLILLYWELGHRDVAIQRLETAMTALPESARLQQLAGYFSQMMYQQ